MTPAPQAAEAPVPSSESKIFPGTETGKGPSREGPWLASCRYWAPARSAEKSTNQLESAKDKTPAVRGKLQPNGHELDVYLDIKGPERDWGCGSDERERWGLPSEEPPRDKNTPSAVKREFAPHITAVIATVPDPIHTHLALAFDRAVVAILEAASDNHYVSSSYWLPWARHGAPVRAADSAGEDETGHDPEREREPGLIVLKYVPLNKGEEKGPAASYYRVIYLFLVAETPSRGIDGFQLTHAFAYEKELVDGLEPKETQKEELAGKVKPKAGCDPSNPLASTPVDDPEFRRGKECHVAMIGPLYTGSAASLRVGIEDAHARHELNPFNALDTFDLYGKTISTLAVDQLTKKVAHFPNPSLSVGQGRKKNLKGKTSQNPDPGVEINYHSFDSNSHFSEQVFLDRLRYSGSLKPGARYPQVAGLTEDNTALGGATSDVEPTRNAKDKTIKGNWAIEQFRFPREISLLRNAQIDADSSSNSAAPSPYLKLSGKDIGELDELPQFSRDNTPLSQEAELMSLSRQLQHDRVGYLVVSGPSSALDQIFLGRFLHRSNPNTRLVFLNSDLLMVREVDSTPFLGSITVSPYPMVNMDDRAYSDAEGAAYYNAASMTFWRKEVVPDIRDSLDSSYHDPLTPIAIQPSLWATAIGTDGYYPLGQLSPCASDYSGILPRLDNEGHTTTEDCNFPKSDERKRLDQPFPVSRLWIGVSLFVGLMCLVHTVMVAKARYWSPVTRSLALEENDEQASRAVYMQVGGMVLFLMAYAMACPVLALHSMSNTSWSNVAGAWTLLALGIASAGTSSWKTVPGLFRREAWMQGRRMLRRQGALMYVLVCLECAGMIGIWSSLCWSNTPLKSPSYRGLSFSYRCIHPESGVSPLVPLLLLLFSWHLWSLLQTGRLRFSRLGRPSVPCMLHNAGDRYFVSSEQLSTNRPDGGRCLYGNIWETFVVERLFWRIEAQRPRTSKWLAFAATVGLPTVLAVVPLFNGVDHFLWNTGRKFPSPYEALLGVLFYPLFVMAMLGWSRVLLVWYSLRRDLLDRLENQPIRFAFNRLKGMGWMALMQQGAVYEHWRDMARSIESIRQTLHQEELETRHPALAWELDAIQKEILELVALVRLRAAGAQPQAGERASFELMSDLEMKFGEFGQSLLSGLLVPYWATERVGLVESDMMEAMPVKARRSETRAEEHQLAMDVFAEPEAERELIVAAEEYIALRYIALIRAVLTSLRYVMAFVSAFFVLAIVAWNSYPFQPRELVDWLTTCLMVVLGAGMIWVFAQMHRNPILSRATDTKANELGWDFYLRVVSFGAIPLVTWLAYSFPEVGGFIYRIVQPGVSVLK